MKSLHNKWCHKLRPHSLLALVAHDRDGVDQTAGFPRAGPAVTLLHVCGVLLALFVCCKYWQLIVALPLCLVWWVTFTSKLLWKCFIRRINSTLKMQIEQRFDSQTSIPTLHFCVSQRRYCTYRVIEKTGTQKREERGIWRSKFKILETWL